MLLNICPDSLKKLQIIYTVKRILKKEFAAAILTLQTQRVVFYTVGWVDEGTRTRVRWRYVRIHEKI
jgi:hypothetical protein